MALDTVMANSSLLPGTVLKYRVLPIPPTGVTPTALAIANLTRNAFNGAGVDMTIGTKTDSSTEAIAPVLQDADVIQVGYNSGSLMSHNNLFTTYLRITPPSAYDGKFIAQNIQKQFGWNRIAVFTVSDDTDSVDTMTEFSEEAAVSGLNIIVTVMFSLGTTDLSKQIAQAAQFDPRVILVLMPPQSTAMFVQQAYQKGLVKEGVTVIGTSYSAGPDLMTFFNSTDDVAAMMKGFLIFQANLNWTNTPNGEDFIQRFQSRPASISYAPNGAQICHNNTDDEGWFTIYEQRLNYNASLPFVCSGIVPSTYNAANIANGTGYVYDAFEALARGLDIMVRNATSPITKVDGRALKRIIVDEVQFEGVTGFVSFSAGRTSIGNYGYGDRVDKLPYVINNFNDAYYVANENPFRAIGYYDGDMVYTTCDPSTDVHCSEVIFNTVDNSIPSDSPASTYVEIPVSIRNAIITLASIFMFITAVCMSFMCYYRNDSALRALQPLLLLGTLTGCMTCGAEMIVEAMPVAANTCAARAWLIHLSFVLILGSIMAKIYRIHLIINANGLRKVVVSEMFAFHVFLAGLSFFLIYLVILATVGAPIPAESFTLSITGQKTYQSYCKMTQPVVSYVLYALEAAMILTAMGINMAISNAPKKIHVGAAKLRSDSFFIDKYCIYTVIPLCCSYLGSRFVLCSGCVSRRGLKF